MLFSAEDPASGADGEIPPLVDDDGEVALEEASSAQVPSQSLDEAVKMLASVKRIKDSCAVPACQACQGLVDSWEKKVQALQNPTK